VHFGLVNLDPDESPGDCLVFLSPNPDFMLSSFCVKVESALRVIVWMIKYQLEESHPWLNGVRQNCKTDSIHSASIRSEFMR